MVNRGRIAHGSSRNRIGNRQRRADAFEIAAQPNWEVQRNAGLPERFLNRIDQTFKVDVVTIQLGKNDDPTNTRTLRAKECATRVNLDPRRRANRDRCCLDSSDGSEDLTDEIRIAGRVDDVDVFPVVFEIAKRRAD